jgi:diaminopimelate epimerase
MPAVTPRTLTLTKHHGLGNDFLVLLDVEGRHAGLDTARLAMAACDRRRGIGADGLLVVTSAGGDNGQADADVTMELRNSDGSRAEMSGNGVRCLTQAVLDAGLVAGDRVRVATDLGVRTVECVDRSRPGYMRLRVDMGPVQVVGDDPRWNGGTVQATAIVDAGNPHLVLLDPAVAQVDVVAEGRRIEAKFPEGINVEWIWPGTGPDELDFRVWERGAGATDACGTGSCAAAAAAHAWGRVGRHVVVHNPGGDVTVELGDTVVLIGPAAHVATVAYPWR